MNNLRRYNSLLIFLKEQLYNLYILEYTKDDNMNK